MKQNKKQERSGILIRHALANSGKIKTSEANELLRRHYYCNHEKYVSEILHRLVSSGIFKRVKKGYYEIATARERAEARAAKGKQINQPKLFIE